MLAPVPPILGVAAEVAKRLTLWEERRFEDLLRRAEEHLLLKQRGSQNDTLARADRARRTAAVGAHRKATTLLVSSMLSFEESDDLSWAKELLPTSSLGAQAQSDPPGIGPSPACTTRSSPHRAPSGTFAEHITDMLSAPRRDPRQQDTCSPVCPFLQNLGRLAPASCPLAHAHAALPAAGQQWLTNG